MVILDIMLPDGNGIDLYCEIKSDYRTDDIPVMMMSTHPTMGDVRKNARRMISSVSPLILIILWEGFLIWYLKIKSVHGLSRAENTCILTGLKQC